LECPLDVLAGRLPVALASVAARAPVEDVAAELVAGQARAIGELQRGGEQRDRGRDAREVVAAYPHSEQHVRAIEVGERRALGYLPRPAQLPKRLLHSPRLGEGERFAEQETKL